MWTRGSASIWWWRLEAAQVRQPTISKSDYQIHRFSDEDLTSFSSVFFSFPNEKKNKRTWIGFLSFFFFFFFSLVWNLLCSMWERKIQMNSQKSHNRINTPKTGPQKGWWVLSPLVVTSLLLSLRWCRPNDPSTQERERERGATSLVRKGIGG